MFLVGNEEGQGLLEYGLILVLVSVIVVAIMIVFGQYVGNLYSTIVSSI